MTNSYDVLKRIAAAVSVMDAAAILDEYVEREVRAAITSLCDTTMIAQAWNVSERRVRAHLAANYNPKIDNGIYKIGSAWLVDRAALDRFKPRPSAGRPKKVTTVL